MKLTIKFSKLKNIQNLFNNLDNKIIMIVMMNIQVLFKIKIKKKIIIYYKLIIMIDF